MHRVWCFESDKKDQVKTKLSFDKATQDLLSTNEDEPITLGAPALYCKTYSVDNNTVLACCDKEVLGKNLKEGNYDVHIEEDFYRGEEINEEKLAELLKESNNINLFGKKSVGVALKQGLLSEKDIIKIEGIEHAVIMRL